MDASLGYRSCSCSRWLRTINSQGGAAWELNMHFGSKKLSFATLGFALFCFLLPFTTVSCNQRPVAKFSGFQLAFGTTVRQPEMFGPPKVHTLNPEPLAVIAFFCCALAFGLAFTKSRGGEIAVAVSSVISFLSLLFFKSTFEDEVSRQTSGVLEVNYEFGFWLTLLCNMSGAALNALAPWREKKTPPLSVGT
jgi:hypothetical protein